jgi:hypothetical protein
LENETRNKIFNVWQDVRSIPTILRSPVAKARLPKVNWHWNAEWFVELGHSRVATLLRILNYRKVGTGTDEESDDKKNVKTG